MAKGPGPFRFKGKKLAPGRTYPASFDDLYELFNKFPFRKDKLPKLRDALLELKKGGFKTVYLYGPFFDFDNEPDDEPKHIDGYLVAEKGTSFQGVDPVFSDTNPPREAMRNKYGVSFSVIGRLVVSPGSGGVNDAVPGSYFCDWEGNPRGLIRLNIQEI